MNKQIAKIYITQTSLQTKHKYIKLPEPEIPLLETDKLHSSTIAILTDFGLKDNYVGVLKGVIYSINTHINIVDITHNIPFGNILDGAFILKCSYNFFPKSTIFVCIVDPGVGTKRKPLLIRTSKYIFIGPDNGIFSYILSENKILYCLNINNKNYFLEPISNTFHGRDIFAPVAAYVSKGIVIKELGDLLTKCVTLPILEPKIKQNKIIGYILHCDHFGNIITNIKPEHIKGYSKIEIHIKDKIINKISNNYQEVKQGELLAIWGSSGFLEISVNKGSAQGLIFENQ